MDATPCELYLLTPPSVLDPEQFVALLRAAMRGGDVAALQVRLKDRDGFSAPDDMVCALASAVAATCRAAGTALIINDRPDLARALDADGVHVGPDDASVSEARTIVGPDAIVGATCRSSLHAAFVAGEHGADYVAFGAFHAGATKNVAERADPEILRRWSSIAVLPSVAIGGIDVERAGPLVAAGADMLAVCGGVWAHPDGPEAAVRAFHAEIAAVTGRQARNDSTAGPSRPDKQPTGNQSR